MQELPDPGLPPLEGESKTAEPDRLLVCIGPSPLSLALIRATHRIAVAQGAKWFALYVETPSHERLPRKSGKWSPRLYAWRRSWEPRWSRFPVSESVLRF